MYNQAVLAALTPGTPGAAIETAVSNVGTDLTAVAGLGLAVGVSIFLLKKGWGLFKRFTG